MVYNNYQHATAVKIDGCGVLIVGDSGVGKTDLALELLTRGHSLIADDMVDVSVLNNQCYIASSKVVGRSQFMYVRDLGFLDLIDLFGDSAVETKTPLAFIVKLNDIKDFKSFTPAAETCGEFAPTNTESLINKSDKLLDPLSSAIDINIKGVKVKCYELNQLQQSFPRPFSVLLEIIVKLHLKRESNINYCKQFIDYHGTLL